MAYDCKEEVEGATAGGMCAGEAPARSCAETEGGTQDMARCTPLAQQRAKRLGRSAWLWMTPLQCVWWGRGGCSGYAREAHLWLAVKAGGGRRRARATHAQVGSRVEVAAAFHAAAAAVVAELRERGVRETSGCASAAGEASGGRCTGEERSRTACMQEEHGYVLARCGCKGNRGASFFVVGTKEYTRRLGKGEDEEEK